jgi:predicted NAD/FAD-binding protein
MTSTIAVVGGGISGLVAAHYLCRRYRVTVFEANKRLGGHTNTVHVTRNGCDYAVDTGFIAFHETRYPTFVGLLARLGVKWKATPMTFSVRHEETGTEYGGASMNALFGQRSNLVRPSFYRLLAEILKFNRESQRALSTALPKVTIAEFIRHGGYSASFLERYLVPLCSAMWSCPPESFLEFPVSFLLPFLEKHDLLSVAARAPWSVIDGGSYKYLTPLIAPFAHCVRLNSPVSCVVRHRDFVEIQTGTGSSEKFDEVVIACHADEALRVFRDASDVERGALSAFRFVKSEVVIHSDERYLPRRRRVWSCWNYFVPAGEWRRAMLTYNTNIIQGLQKAPSLLVTLNPNSTNLREESWRGSYEHPIFASNSVSVQRSHRDFVRRNRVSFCGAYWGSGFHEAGVVSALEVVRAFGIDDVS